MEQPRGRDCQTVAPQGSPREAVAAGEPASTITVCDLQRRYIPGLIQVPAPAPRLRYHGRGVAPPGHDGVPASQFDPFLV